LPSILTSRPWPGSAQVSSSWAALRPWTEAPIFQLADYGLVGDLFEIVPQITAELG